VKRRDGQIDIYETITRHVEAWSPNLDQLIVKDAMDRIESDRFNVLRKINDS